MGFFPNTGHQELAARVFYILVGLQHLLRVPSLLPSCASLCFELYIGQKEGKPPKVAARAKEASAGSQDCISALASLQPHRGHLLPKVPVMTPRGAGVSFINYPCLLTANL